MDYTHLGRTGLRVSRLCLGTMNFGPRTSEQDSFAMMDRALELGINFFDTANVYGHLKHEGATEQIIGRWLAQGGGRREQLVLATKVYGQMGDGPNDVKLSAWNIRQAVEASLKRLQTDHVDLYQMHHVDRDTPWEEIWQAMQKLVADGKVLYVGSSNFAGWHITQANEAARGRNSLGLVSEQCRYSLLCRQPELEVLPACQAYGVGVIPYSPMGGGMLCGAWDSTDKARRASEGVQKQLQAFRGQIEPYEAFCDQLGQPPADVALAWTLSQPAITSPIIGPRTMEQLAGSARALALKLSDEDLAKLDEIWPGPGGPAPEAWAW